MPLDGESFCLTDWSDQFRELLVNCHAAVGREISVLACRCREVRGLNTVHTVADAEAVTDVLVYAPN